MKSGQQKFELFREKGSGAGVLTEERPSEEGGTQAPACRADGRAPCGAGGGDPPGALALLKANGFTNLLPVISPFCPVLLQADLERTRKAKRRLE